MSEWTAETLVSAAALLWVGALTVIVVWKLFTRAIDLSWLLYGDRSNGEVFFSPARVQLLIATIFLAMHLLVQVIAHPTVYPHIPPEFLAAVGGSQAVYLGGKARALLR